MYTLTEEIIRMNYSCRAALAGVCVESSRLSPSEVVLAPALPHGPVVAAAMARGHQGNSRWPQVKCDGTAYLVSLLIKLGCKAPVPPEECVL